ncbi:ROK family protein [Aliikangiella sp. IMCC44632]
MTSDAKPLVSCDLGGTKLIVRVEKSQNVDDFYFSTGVNFTPQKMQSILQKIEGDYQLENYHLAVAFPGLLKANVCHLSHMVPEFEGFDLAGLSSNAKLKVALNDVEAGTYGIISNQYKVEVLIMSGTGVGMGVAIDGKVFKGEHGFSGELGACKIEKNGELYSVTQLASGGSYHKSHHDLKLQKNSMADYGEQLGGAVSWIINCFNPGRIVFAGGMFNESDYRDACLKKIASLSLQPLVENCQLEVHTEMKDIVVNGLKKAIQQA